LVDKNTAEMVDIHVVNEAQDPYGQIKEAVVVLEGLLRKFNTITGPFYVESFRNPLGSWEGVELTLDNQSGCSDGSPIFAHFETIYLQLGRWRHLEEPQRREKNTPLILEPTGRKNVHFGECTDY
jgi:hypothetical protein